MGGITADQSSRPYPLPYDPIYKPTSSSSYFNRNQPPSTFSTSTGNRNQATESLPTTSGYYTAPTNRPFIGQHNNNVWGDLASGAKVAIVIVVVGVILIVLASIWCCCGCCIGGRRGGRKRHTPPGQENRGDLPLSTISGAETRGRQDNRGLPVDGDLPPPQYEETVPHQHQTIAGGITHVREEEEGVISDGKTPLSEIPFEDVVLDHPVSAGSGSGSGSPSSAREFATRHHGLGGDTRGHTNS